MRHSAAGCNVCSSQIKPIDSTLYFPPDQILRKINVPEVHHNGVSCMNCNSKPLSGNAFKCSECDNYILCESCQDFRTHRHRLHYVTGKLKLLKLIEMMILPFRT